MIFILGATGSGSTVLLGDANCCGHIVYAEAGADMIAKFEDRIKRESDGRGSVLLISLKVRW